MSAFFLSPAELAALELSMRVARLGGFPELAAGHPHRVGAFPVAASLPVCFGRFHPSAARPAADYARNHYQGGVGLCQEPRRVRGDHHVRVQHFGQTQTLPLTLYTFTQIPDGEEGTTRLCIIAVGIAMAALLCSEMLETVYRLNEQVSHAG